MSIKVEDVKNENGLWIKSYNTNKIRYVTRSYVVWHNMIQRCRAGGAYQQRMPTYEGCSVSDEFKDFQVFTEWHRKQVGYCIEGYDLEKDILTGGKVYSKESCALVPHMLNSFLVSCTAARGKYPQGVSFSKAQDKLQVLIRIDGKRTHLGYYDDIEEAATAYKAAKEAEAYRWYERLLAGEFIVDARVIERMRTWTLPDSK